MSSLEVYVIMFQYPQRDLEERLSWCLPAFETLCNPRGGQGIAHGRARERKIRDMPERDEEQRPLVACVTVGAFQENCYLYACPQTLEAVIIDPGDEAQRILDRIQELQFIPKYIINTHGHID